MQAPVVWRHQPLVRPEFHNNLCCCSVSLAYLAPLRRSSGHAWRLKIVLAVLRALRVSVVHPEVYAATAHSADAEHPYRPGTPSRGRRGEASG